MRSTTAAGRGRRGRTTPTARTRAVLVGGALAVLLLDTWGLFPASAQAGTGRPGPGADAPSFTTPLATSVQVGGGTWATVAMGDLNQPLNTFWQLMFRPEGSSTWSDRVEATAVATNGGLVMATSASSLIVGVRPSDDLTFSPLISTTDSGRSWSNGLLDQGLAARPRSLAEGPGGNTLAVVQGHGGAEVVRSTDNLSTWQPLTTVDALTASEAGRACSPNAITSVGYVSSRPVVGVSCQRPGPAGIFLENGRTWKLTGPTLSPGAGSAEVLGLMPAKGGEAALLGLTRPGTAAGSARTPQPTAGSGTKTASGTETSLVAAWAGPNANSQWHTSAPLGLGPDGRLISFGAPSETGGGIFALTAGGSGHLELAVASSSRRGWESLPAPPSTTATVAFLPGGTVDALAVRNVDLTVWALSPGSDAWVKGQVLDVPVQFGSSS
jgi:hypothetical protein